MEEKMEVKVIEKKQDILIQEQEIARKEKELEATVRKPAEAERYRLEKLAEANKEKLILEAEAEAEAIRLKGEAEAAAISAKARAEAETIAKKADAYKQYESASRIEMVLKTLPMVCGTFYYAYAIAIDWFVCTHPLQLLMFSLPGRR